MESWLTRLAGLSNTRRFRLGCQPACHSTSDMPPSPANPPLFPPPHSLTVMASKQHLPRTTATPRSPTDWAPATTPASSSRSSYSDPSSRSTDASSTVVGNNTRREDPADEEDVNSAFEREAYGTPTGEKADPFEVKMGPEDPDNPQKWSRAYRWYITMLAAILLLNACVQFLSESCDAAAHENV